jgi:hypothetical protein
VPNAEAPDSMKDPHAPGLCDMSDRSRNCCLVGSCSRGLRARLCAPRRVACTRYGRARQSPERPVFRVGALLPSCRLAHPPTPTTVAWPIVSRGLVRANASRRGARERPPRTRKRMGSMGSAPGRVTSESKREMLRLRRVPALSARGH